LKKIGQLKHLVFLIVILMGLSIIVIALNETTQEILGNISENNASILNESAIGGSPNLDNSSVSANAGVTNPLNNLDPNLATVVNGKSIFEDPYIEIYMQKFNNLRNVEFKTLTSQGDYFLLKVGHGDFGNLDGFILNNRKYVLHLLWCDHRVNDCIIRINGALFNVSIEGKSTIGLDSGHLLKIKSIKFDVCELEICDYLYDVYDFVESEVVER